MVYRFEPYPMGKWLVGEKALNLTFDPVSSVFGKPAKWRCDYCGPIGEPETVCTYKGCGFESHWGPEPAEYEDYCPSCNRSECCGENQDGCKITVLKRYKATINRRKSHENQ